MAGLAAARMSSGSEFYTAGPACEKVRFPNLVRSCGVRYLWLEVITPLSSHHQIPSFPGSLSYICGSHGITVTHTDT